MLGRMLFVGVGGSGGKTLRFLRRELNQRLLEKGWTGPFPPGWQLIHIDTPNVQDGAERGLAENLPERDYVGVAQKDLPYEVFDRQLRQVIQQHGGDLRSVAGWLPHQKTEQRFIRGAGQFRALGRVAYASGAAAIADRLWQAVRAIQDATNDHRTLTRVLGGQADGDDVPPTVMVISSIAGGSGAGMTLDVCDLLRYMGGHEAWLGQAITILYAPDVFDELPRDLALGVAPNALAMMSELLAACWDDTAFDPSAQAFIESARVAGTTSGHSRRGPEVSVLVGRRNDALVFADQVEVYRAMGASLASMATNDVVQDNFRAYTLGNAGLAVGAGSQVGVPFLPELGAKPVTALGFTSLGLGRDRFAEYASERVARMAAHHLLEAHYTDDVRSGRMTPEDARDKKVDEVYDDFVGGCRLNERSTENNQVLDALRSEDTVRSVLSGLKADIKSVLAQYNDEVPAADWAARIEGRVAEARPDFERQQMAERERAASAWVTDIQQHVVDTVTAFIGDYGLAVTAELLRRLDRELGDVVGELQTEATEHRTKAGSQGAGIRRTLGEWAAAALRSDNLLLEKAAKVGLGEFWLSSEYEVRILAADLLSDFRLNFLKYLADSVSSAEVSLRREAAGERGQASIYAMWPIEGVPDHMQPAANEFLLEPCDGYPAAFEQKVTQTVGEKRFGDAQKAVRSEVTAGRWTGFGDNEGEYQHPIAIDMRTTWSSSVAAVRQSGSPEPAQFTTYYTLGDILDRSRRWVYQDGRAIGQFVAEGLTEYLNPSSHIPESETRERQDRFAGLLRRAIEAASPLVDVNASVASRVYGSPELESEIIMTPLPLEAGTRVRELAEEILQTVGGVKPANLGRYFSSAPQSRIDITQLPAARCNPVVLNSFTAPILADWRSRSTEQDRTRFWRGRRSRSLDKFAPVPGDVLDQMVRGWLIAQVLGLVSEDGLQVMEVKAGQPTSAWLPFPHPLLGPDPATRSDMFAAILESMPLALVEFGSGNDKPAFAYQSLVEIGKGDQPVVLRSWIANGVLGNGGHVPDAGLAGPPGAGDDLAGERKEAVLATLAETRAAVTQWSADFGPTESRPPTGRAWELEAEFLDALTFLEEQVRNQVTGGGRGVS